MPDITTQVEYLADLPLYEHQKPYYVFYSTDDNELKSIPPTNLEFEQRNNILVQDLRGREHEFTLDQNGFEIIKHASKIKLPLQTPKDMETYKHEIEELLRNKLNALHVYCYEARLRENDNLERESLDLRDPMLVERPAAGAHVDATFDSAKKIMETRLPEEYRLNWLKSGYRRRLINTWRTMNLVLEDRPLAVCDYASVNKNDLLPADRIIPIRAGEIYYLKYNPNHGWYWLDHMTSEELFIMKTFDSQQGKISKYCPHVSVENPLATPGAERRKSIETRCIVISED